MRTSTTSYLLSILLQTTFSADWEKFPGLDCYPGLGGELLGPEPYSDNISLAKCQAACQEGCVGVVRRTDQGKGAGLCYRRSKIERAQCAEDDKWDLYMVRAQEGNSWTHKPGIDCYEGKGGVPISPNPLPGELSPEECQAACRSDPACVAVVRPAGSKSLVCYKRSSITLSKCVRDNKWDLYIAAGASATTVPPSTSSKPTSVPSQGWKQYPGVDCYSGKGGQPISPDPFSDSLTRSECQAACSRNPACEGVVRRASEQGAGVCYLRSNIVLAQCVRDPVWDLTTKRGVGGSGNPTTAKPSGGSYGCRYGIQSYPRNLPNSHYYTRLCTTYSGLKVISANRASQRALERTAFLLDHVMDQVDPRVASSMNSRGFRHAVMAAYPSELTTHLPEHAFLDPGFWNERARGLGATVAVPLGSSAEENALCYPNDRYRSEDITIHEFAHSLHLTGLALVFRGFNSELTGLYNAARSYGTWGSGHYAMTDFKEYFAEGVQSFFDTNAPDSYAPTTREQLRRKDPNFYAFLYRYLGNNNWKRTC